VRGFFVALAAVGGRGLRRGHNLAGNRRGRGGGAGADCDEEISAAMFRLGGFHRSLLLVGYFHLLICFEFQMRFIYVIFLRYYFSPRSAFNLKQHHRLSFHIEECPCQRRDPRVEFCAAALLHRRAKRLVRSFDESVEEPPLILLLDIIQNPQNLGTLLRTAEAVGVHGVIIPERRSAGITPAVVSASSGASEHMLVAVMNLAQAIQALKEREVWIVGLEGSPEAHLPGEVDLSGALGLVIGNEGEGMRRLVRQSCDFLLRLPMRGRVESLNAAVAGSTALYFAWQARGFLGHSELPNLPISIDVLPKS